MEYRRVDREVAALTIRAEIESLLRDARECEGSEKIELLEGAVRLADSANDANAGFDARMALVEAGIFNGTPDKSLVAFAWCLAESDRNPSEERRTLILWRYKWVVQNVPGFVTIGRQQISSMLADLRRRYIDAGVSLRPVFEHECIVASYCGDTEAASAAYEAWLAAPRDYFADCFACDLNEQFKYLLFVGKAQEAIARAGPILRGRARCAEVPHITFAHILEPLRRLGQGLEADGFQRRGYRLISRNSDFLDEVSRHIRFLSRSGSPDRALKMWVRHLPWALKSRLPLWKWRFADASVALFRELSDIGKRDFPARLPSEFAGSRDRKRHSVESLLAHFQAEATTLATQFDARNGNDFYGRMTRETREGG